MTEWAVLKTDAPTTPAPPQPVHTVETVAAINRERIEYRVLIRPAWSSNVIELSATPEDPWRNRAHVCDAAKSVSDDYTVHRRIDGGEWKLMVRVTCK